jgi:hypothetical protein
MELGATLHERGPDPWLPMCSADPIPLETLGVFLPRWLAYPKRVSIW